MQRRLACGLSVAGRLCTPTTTKIAGSPRQLPCWEVSTCGMSSTLMPTNKSREHRGHPWLRWRTMITHQLPPLSIFTQDLDGNLSPIATNNDGCDDWISSTITLDCEHRSGLLCRVEVQVNGTEFVVSATCNTDQSTSPSNDDCEGATSMTSRTNHHTNHFVEQMLKSCSFLGRPRNCLTQCTSRSTTVTSISRPHRTPPTSATTTLGWGIL